MSNINFEQKVTDIAIRSKELIELVWGMKCGEEVDFNHIKTLIHEFHKEELELMGIICENEMEKKYQKTSTFEIPSFLQARES